MKGWTTGRTDRTGRSTFVSRGQTASARSPNHCGQILVYVSNNLAVSPHLGPNVPGEFLGRVRCRSASQRLNRLCDLGIRDDTANSRVELADDLGWRTRRGKQAQPPRPARKARVAGFCDGRHFGKLL